VRAVAVSIGVVAALSASAAADPLRLTYGADLGVSAMREANRSGRTSSDWFAAASFGAEIGATVTPTLAMTLRLLAARGGDAQAEGDFNHVSSTFLGPRIEYRPHGPVEFALGFGAGAFDDPRRLGYAADLYLGVTVWDEGPNRVSIALESTPTFVPLSEAQDSRDLVNFALLVAFRRR
jgi:hypothetical protein